jgi:hypothetical protein
MVIAARQQAQSRKEQQCTESDDRDDEGKLKERVTIQKTETRQMKTYRDKANNLIYSYMSEGMNALSREKSTGEG